MSSHPTSRDVVLVNGAVVIPDGIIDGGAIVVQNGVIATVGPVSDVKVPDGADVIDVGGRRVLPGFIDVHVHGMMGQDVADGDLSTIASALARHGVTSFVATLAAAPRAALVASISRLVAFRRQQDCDACDARLVGIYLEGPFVSPCRAGALDSRWFSLPSITEAQEYVDAGQGLVRIVAVAPELPGTDELVRWLTERGVIASIGHSDATFEQVCRLIPLGLRHATHVFNAMRPLNHRAPGVVGAVLIDDTVTAEYIGDGHHLHPAVVTLLLRSKGPDRLCLISDSAPLAGLPDGVYEWLGQRVTVSNGTATHDDGTLAGSVVPLDGALRAITRSTDLPLETLLPTATTTPARLMGLDAGAIVPGLAADLVVVDDAFEVELTVVGGHIAYRRP